MRAPLSVMVLSPWSRNGDESEAPSSGNFLVLWWTNGVFSFCAVLRNAPKVIDSESRCLPNGSAGTFRFLFARDSTNENKAAPAPRWSSLENTSKRRVKPRVCQLWYDGGMVRRRPFGSWFLAPRGWSASLCLGVAVCLLAGCNRQEAALCQDSFNSAQATVNQIDSSSIDSVQQSLKAMDGAIAACEAAGKSGEVEELGKARQKISAHYEWLKSRPPKRRERSAEELARLVKQGDPDCPKGMAYKQRESGKEVRCVGPVPVNMPWDKARAYYERRDFRVRPGKRPATLEMEYGAELLVFEYADERSAQPPKCLLVYPPPGMSWQEATARVTGARVDRIEAGKSLKAGKRELMLQVVDEPNKVLVKLGQC